MEIEEQSELAEKMESQVLLEPRGPKDSEDHSEPQEIKVHQDQEDEREILDSKGTRETSV